MRPILESAAWLRGKKISSRELVDDTLRRIEEVNPRLNAFQTVMSETARVRAAEADAALAHGEDLGPLHGIPVAVKDCYETRGVRTTCGSKLFADNVPARNAAVVDRLAAAGAIVIAKTTMHELAYGITSSNPHFGAVRNPWNPGCVPGGSSGGSGAAVAARAVPIGMGSDTGGSIRIPASFCGVAGLKPTSGRVSRHGVMPLDFSLDHMGPIGLTVRDCAVVLEAIAGWDPRDDTSSRVPVSPYVPAPGVRLDGLRIGLPKNFYFEAVDPAVEPAVREMARVAASLGATVVDCQVPDIAAINAVARVILLAEASALMEPFVLTRRADIGADVLALLDHGRLIPATDYLNAQRLRRVQQREFARLWEAVDLLFTPTAAIGAPHIGQTTVSIAGKEEDTRLASTKFVRGINHLGNPALSIPCGFDAANMPLGLQIVGKPFAEATVLRCGAALEDATEFHHLRPPD